MVYMKFEEKNKFTSAELLIAIKNSNLPAFNSLIKNLQHDSNAMLALFNHVDEDGNNVFHSLLVDDIKWYQRGKKKRHARAEIMFKLLNILKSANLSKPLDVRNNDGNTPFHQVIQRGYDDLFSMMLKIGADITVCTSSNESTLLVAAKHKKNKIYKKLLSTHTELNKKTSIPRGYTSDQIDEAGKVFIKNLDHKHIAMGVFGSILAIACPLGTILTFSELPVLELFFASLIPVAGPLIGLIGAFAVGGLLYWSMYQKSVEKYGEIAQKMARLDMIDSKISRLEVELSHINSSLANIPKDHPSYRYLKSQSVKVLAQLNTIYESLENVDEIHHAKTGDWADSDDEFRTVLLTFGSFACSFSGVLGILGALSSFMPALITSSVVFVGVPVVGWCALGVALAVGVTVAVWAYHSKFKPNLEQCGELKQKMHEKQLSLCNKKELYHAPRIRAGIESKQILQVLQSNGIQIHRQIEPKPQLEPHTLEVSSVKPNISALNRSFLNLLSGLSGSKNKPLDLSPPSSELQSIADPDTILAKAFG